MNRTVYSESDSPTENVSATISLLYHNRTEKCWPLQKVYGIDYVDYTVSKIIFGLLYGLVLIFGLAANALTLHCLKSKPLHFGLNSKLFISLTLADLLMSLTSLPITTIHIFTRRWLLGSFLCRYAPLLQGTCVFATSFTLMAIAIERYINVAKTSSSASVSGKHMPHAHSFCICAIWITACIASVPYAWYMRLAPNCVDAGSRLVCVCGQFCDERWPTDMAKMTYGSVAVVAQFVAPLIVLIICYWRVRRAVGKSVRRRLTNGENLSVHGRRQLIRRKKRTSFITMILLLCFVAPWLPVNVLNLLRDYRILAGQYESLAFAIAHLIAMTSILWNPMVYCLYNREFFQAFKNVLVCRPTDAVKSASGGTGPEAETLDNQCCYDKQNVCHDDDKGLKNEYHGCLETTELNGVHNAMMY